MPGFSTGDTFKIFIGKIPEKTSVLDIKPLFERYGKVVECDVVKNYGFVHMEDPEAGYEAIKHLNGAIVNGGSITVEEAKSKKKSGLPTTKIFVGNIADGISVADIKQLFSKYGSVAECDLVRNYGFVHIDTTDLTKLLKELNGYDLSGQQLKVQISTSRVRQRPGMGNPQSCYKCGRTGHWSKECTKNPSASGLPQPQYLQDPLHPASARSAYPRDLYPPPPPSATFIRERILSSYAVPDMRDYYDHYAAMDRYDDYAALGSRREAYASAARLPTAEYDVYGRRSPTSAAAISHYTADGRAYDYPAAAASYSYAEENWAMYDEYAAAMSRNSHFDERRSDRRDGVSRSSSRYAPY